jgi:zinc/manganese transport system substrate-binding protein
MRTVWVFLPLLWLGIAEAAGLRVVATSTSTGFLVREIGAGEVALTILTPPDRDLHYHQARPSMIGALRRADLVTAVGAELEAGWLPAAIASAANPKILPGQPGYFEAAAQVELLETGRAADRALGDVHPVGNPHVNMDPARMAVVGEALAARLAQLDPANADAYRRRADGFRRASAARLEVWRGQAEDFPGGIAYHKDVVYLFATLRVPYFGTIEPVAGIPPTAQHLKALTDRLAGQSGVVLYTLFQPAKAPEALARNLGWPAVRLPLEPPLEADGAGYLDHMEAWVAALAGRD